MDEELSPPSPLCERDGDEGKEAEDAISIDREMSSIADRIISLTLMSINNDTRPNAIDQRHER